jgi:hypothetical protein
MYCKVAQNVRGAAFNSYQCFEAFLLEGHEPVNHQLKEKNEFSNNRRMSNLGFYSFSDIRTHKVTR